MGIPGALGAAGIGHYAVGTDVVASPHDGDEGRNAVLVRAHRRNVRVGLVPGKEDVYLRADCFQQAGEGTVGVRPCDQIHLSGIQQLVFQAFRHAPHDAHHEPGTFFPELVEYVQPSPDALLGIVADAAGVGHHQIGLFHDFRARVPGLPEDGKNDFGVIDVHLAPVCLNIGFLHIACKDTK